MKSSIETKMNMFKKYLNKTNMSHKIYQYDAVRWCLKNELTPKTLYNVRGGIIAYEMGLGKTIIMIGLMYCNFVPQTLIVLPPILIEQWFSQIYKTSGHKALIYHGKNKKKIKEIDLNEAPIVITSYYEIAKKKKKSVIHEIIWSRVIFDEAHHLRNKKTASYKGAYNLPAKIRWLVSGTPVQNSYKDFYNLCSLIRLPKSFYKNNNNLPIIMNSFILKRTKKEVDIEISPIQIKKIIVPWTNDKELSLSKNIHSTLKFSRILNGEKELSHAYGKKGILSLMLRAKQSCILPKMLCKSLKRLIKDKSINDYSCYKDGLVNSSKLDAVINTIIKNKGNGSGKLVFCHFHEEIDEISIRLRNLGIKNVVTFDGRTNYEERKKILNEKNEVLILQIQTGCEGLNLQDNYSEIYFISPHWNPSVEEQAIARCHRIGQCKPVYVYKYEMEEFTDEEKKAKTIDKYVVNVQEYKRAIINEIFHYKN